MTTAPTRRATRKPWWRRPRLLLSALPIAAILITLLLFDLNDTEHMPWTEDPCGLHDSEQNSISARMYLPIARWALRYTPTPRVAILTIDATTRPASIMTNSCESRAFLARLVRHLNMLSARAIVIDQYFSPDYCSEADKTNAFINSVATSKVPVVLGQGTHALPQSTSSGGCLALSKRLDIPASHNVSFGLTRIVSDDLKIPFRWPVFQDPAKPDAPAQQRPADDGITLSFAAAKAAEPTLMNDPPIDRVLRKGYFPYTTFIDLPQANAMTVMCSVEQQPHDVFGNKLGVDCDSWARPLDNLDQHGLSLNGKIVIIGAVVPTDMKPFPTGLKPGVYLHANYIESILDHRFLIEVPTGITLALLAIFMLAVYSLYWAHDAHGTPLLKPTKAALISVILLIGAIAASLLVLVTTSYYTPLWALWAAGAVSLLRGLEEVGYAQSEHLGKHFVRETEEEPAHVEASTHVTND
ncbi:MAG TPA: CHASE2 domain-containing protein [Acidobacteriaceae bacterium]